MRKQTLAPETQVPAGYVVLPYKNTGGFAAAHKDTLKWVTNARRQPLNRASKAAALQALLQHLAEQAPVTAEPVAAEQAPQADPATLAYEAAQAAAQATGEAQPLEPGDEGRMVQADGSVVFSMAWIEAHAEQDERPVVVPALPAAAQEAQVHVDRLTADLDASVAPTPDAEAAEAEDEDAGEPVTHATRMTPADEALLAKLAAGAAASVVYTRNDLSRPERRTARRLVRMGKAVQVHVTDPRPGHTGERVAWTVAAATAEAPATDEAV